MVNETPEHPEKKWIACMCYKAQSNWCGDRAHGEAGTADHHRLVAVAINLVWGNWRGLKKNLHHISLKVV